MGEGALVFVVGARTTCVCVCVLGGVVRGFVWGSQSQVSPGAVVPCMLRFCGQGCPRWGPKGRAWGLTRTL